VERSLEIFTQLQHDFEPSSEHIQNTSGTIDSAQSAAVGTWLQETSIDQ